MRTVCIRYQHEITHCFQILKSDCKTTSRQHREEWRSNARRDFGPLRPQHNPADSEIRSEWEDWVGGRFGLHGIGSPPAVTIKFRSVFNTGHVMLMWLVALNVEQSDKRQFVAERAPILRDYLQSWDFHHIDYVLFPFTSITDELKTSSNEINNMSLTKIINPVNKDKNKEDHPLSFIIYIYSFLGRHHWSFGHVNTMKI